MQTGALAKQLGVSSNTIRNWTREYVAFLSPIADPGQTRLFTPRDVEVLREVSRLRTMGLQREAITLQLASMKFPDEVVSNSQQIEAQRTAPAPQQAADGPELPSLVVAMLREEIASVRQESAQAARQQRDRVTVFLYGALAGLLAGVLLFWMAFGLANLAK